MSIKGTPLYVVTVLLTGKGFILGACNKKPKEQDRAQSLGDIHLNFVLLFFLGHTFRQEWFIRIMILEFVKGI